MNDDNTQADGQQDDQSLLDKVTDAIPGDMDDKLVDTVTNAAETVSNAVSGGMVDKVTDAIPGDMDDKLVDAVGDAASKVGDMAGAAADKVGGLNPMGAADDSAADDAAGDEDKAE
jgi:hypothetical protein